MTACSICGRELPEGALFCPGCGASTVAFSAARTEISPSHFNSGMTATSLPLTGQPPAPPGDSGLVPPSPPLTEEKKSFIARRRGILLAVIAILAVLLVGTAFEAGMLGSGAAPAVNSASTPLTGGELYAAYAANESQATASYANKTVYIQDSLDFGVGLDQNTGQYFSSVDSGNVILFWSSPSQVSQLSAGSMVLARCSVGGEQQSQGEAYVLVLNDCSLVGVQSQAAASASVSENND
ncbi:MAG: zinc ribbon domain-containing protein [Thaumarchaeota archaeon]|nr:zinc ribbon domain-containing protein [Nitrososphaerota archaeon]